MIISSFLTSARSWTASWADNIRDLILCPTFWLWVTTIRMFSGSAFYLQMSWFPLSLWLENIASCMATTFHSPFSGELMWRRFPYPGSCGQWRHGRDCGRISVVRYSHINRCPGVAILPWSLSPHTCESDIGLFSLWPICVYCVWISHVVFPLLVYCLFAL